MTLKHWIIGLTYCRNSCLHYSTGWEILILQDKHSHFLLHVLSCWSAHGLLMKLCLCMSLFFCQWPYQLLWILILKKIERSITYTKNALHVYDINLADFYRHLAMFWCHSCWCIKLVLYVTLMHVYNPYRRSNNI